MLQPYEAAELQRRQARWPLHWLMITLGALASVALPFGVDIAVHGSSDHLLGRTDAVTATVDSVAMDGNCGRSRNSTRYRVLASWELNGQPGNGRYHVCERQRENAPVEGSTVQLWVTDDGTVRDESPTTTRVGMTVLSVVLLAAVAGSSVPLVVSARRRRQRLLGGGHRPLAPGTPVEVTAKPRQPLRMKPLHGTGPVVNLSLTVRNRPGGSLSTLTTYNVKGRWWLHLAPDDGGKRRIGLLVRERERCWIEVPAKRLR